MVPSVTLHVSKNSETKDLLKYPTVNDHQLIQQNSLKLVVWTFLRKKLQLTPSTQTHLRITNQLEVSCCRRRQVCPTGCDIS